MLVVGWLLLVAGIVMFPLPGPGLLLAALGMGLLAQHYPWAERRVDDLRRRALLGAARGTVTLPRATGSVAAALLLTAAGALWLWAPAEPAWWVLPSWTWLPGGFWAGISQILSGLATLALVLYAWRRFSGRPELVAQLTQQTERSTGEGSTAGVGSSG